MKERDFMKCAWAFLKEFLKGLTDAEKGFHAEDTTVSQRTQFVVISSASSASSAGTKRANYQETLNSPRYTPSPCWERSLAAIPR